MLRRPSVLYRLAVMLLVGGVAVVTTALAAPGIFKDGETVGALPRPTATSALASVETRIPPTSVPPAEPTAVRVNNSPIARLLIPAISVDAPVVVRGVDSQGVMESPDTPTDVAWYEFSSRPGGGSNIVFAGHVDYHDYGAAVFWSLRDLKTGDEVLIRLADGTESRYVVVSSEIYGAQDAPVLEIVGRTDKEVVTLITCDGAFSSDSRQYDSRLVVRAERVADTQALAN